MKRHAFSFVAVIMTAAGLTTDARAAGALVDCVVAGPDDAIAGVTFGDVAYAELRCRLKGSLTLPYDASRNRYDLAGNVVGSVESGSSVYPYDMPVWIIAPASAADGNGTAIIDPFHTGAVATPLARTRGEGEQPFVLKMIRPRFLFVDGAYTWVGVRWDPAALTTPYPDKRFDHVYERSHGVSPGKLGAPANRQLYVGLAMLADLADVVRSGQATLRGDATSTTFANVARVIAHGDSQTVTTVWRRLLNDPPSPANGGGAHHVPLADGWLLISGGGLWNTWPTISASGTVTVRPGVLRSAPPPRENGHVVLLGTEEDLSGNSVYAVGQEFVRFPPSESLRSYEMPGASHINSVMQAAFGSPGAAIFIPDLTDSLALTLALADADPSYDPTGIALDASTCTDAHPFACSNPIDWFPVDRAVLAALDAWLRDGTPPPPDSWIAKDGGGEGYGVAFPVARDGAGNALGGVRLPVVAADRGRFYAVDPFPGGTAAAPIYPGGSNLAGTYVDRSSAFHSHGAYVGAISRQADALTAARFLLPVDAESIVDEAARSVVGMPPASAKTATFSPLLTFPQDAELGTEDEVPGDSPE